MNIKEERTKALAIIEEYDEIQKKIADDDDYPTYESYVELNGGPNVMTVMAAKNQLKFLDIVDGMTEDEIKRIKDIPIYQDDMREVNDIKEKYGLSWSQMKSLRGGVDRTEHMTLQEMRKALGDSQKAFSKRYEIPLRTLEDWEAGRRKPAPYILKLLERAVLQDLEIKRPE